MTNSELNAYDVYRGLTCHKCGRKYPDTIINVEGVIHHNCKPACIDLKSCKKSLKHK